MKFIPKSTTGPFLMINNITVKDEGSYQCILSSRVRQTEKYYVTLNVISESLEIFLKIFS